FLGRFDGEKPERVRLIRGLMRRFSAPARAHPSLLHSDPVVRPRPEEYRLEVTVGPPGLGKGRWGSGPIARPPCDPLPGARPRRDPLPAAPPRRGAGGSLALLVQNTIAAAHSARLRIHASTPEEP